jgi:hypothetical protein
MKYENLGILYTKEDRDLLCPVLYSRSTQSKRAITRSAGHVTITV